MGQEWGPGAAGQSVALVPPLAIWGLGRAEHHAAPPQPFNWVCLGISWSLDLQEVQGDKRGVSGCSCGPPPG